MRKGERFIEDVEAFELDDDQFSNIFGLFKSREIKDCIAENQDLGLSKRDSEKKCRLEKRGDDVGADGEAPTEKGACVKHFMAKGMSRRSASLRCGIKDVATTLGGIGDAISGEDPTTEAGMPTTPTNSVGSFISSNKGLVIIGGILGLSLVSFLVIKAVKK